MSPALETGPGKMKGSRSTQLLPTHTSASRQSYVKRKDAHGCRKPWKWWWGSRRPPLAHVDPLL